MKSFFTTVSTILLSLSASISGQTMFSNADQIYCDGLVCPANSVSCTVYRVTTADLSKIEITKQCLDSTGIATATDKDVLPNPNPATAVNSFSKITGSGTISTSDRNLSEAQKEELEATLRAQEQYWSQWTTNFLGNLQAQFPPGFPFN